jgi:hypothetical protein
MAHARQHPFFKRLIQGPLLFLAIIVVTVDDAFRAVVLPAVRAFARLHIVRQIEGLIVRLPAYPTLALFLVPLGILEFIKVYALYLIGEGRFGAAALTFVAAKVIGLGLAERLFTISRDKLLSIGWFAAGYRKIIAVRDFVHEWLERRLFWQRAKRVLRHLHRRLRAAREGLARAIARLRAEIAARAGRGRFAAARRRIRRAGRHVQL